MNKIVSFSLWGDNPKYTIGAVKNAHLVQELYSGWIGRFYCGRSVPQEILDKLNEVSNTEVILIDEEGDWTSTMWRFLSADSNDVVLSRDTDSRISEREVDAVNEWLESDKDFHIMRDHPEHGTQILAGMWGSRNGILKGITEHINSYVKENREEYSHIKQTDQTFLKHYIWPKIENNALSHDEFFNGVPFPKIRKDWNDFVGQVYDEHDAPTQEYAVLLEESQT
jgi:hypothetical protein